MSFHPASISPDVDLRDYLSQRISVSDGGNTTKYVTVYGDWEHPTNKLPSDFITISLNGDIWGVGMDTPFAKGYIIVSLYCKLNDDGSVKKNRIAKILEQFDMIIDKCATGNYYYEYDAEQFITPTTPNQSTGYSVTSLNLRWNTTSNFIKPKITI